MSPGIVAAAEPSALSEADDVISATENERLRAYADAIKSDRDAKEAEVTTLRILLEKCRQGLIGIRRNYNRMLKDGRELSP